MLLTCSDGSGAETEEGPQDAACGHGQLMAQGEELELQVEARTGDGAEKGEEGQQRG